MKLHPNNATRLAIESMLDYLDWLPDISEDRLITVEDGKMQLMPSASVVLEQLKDLKVLQQALANYEAAIKDSLFEKMNNAVKEYNDGEVQIKCVWDKDEKKRFDVSKFKLENPELYEKYLKSESAAGYVNIYWADEEVNDV